MRKSLICIICPNSCNLEIDMSEENSRTICVKKITGGLCSKGEKYARQELMAPCRTIATSVAVRGGVLPLVSVRLTSPIPKERILDAISLIKNCVVEAPVTAGTILIHNILDFEADVITTKSIERINNSVEE